MKELKYRAWDKLNNQILEVLQICFNDRGLPYLRVGIVGRNHNKDYNLRIEDVELMQFTGLYDKNKKEIYEGDVVRSGYFRRAETVEFINGAFMVKADTGSNYTLLSWWCERGAGVQILGNIYLRNCIAKQGSLL